METTKIKKIDKHFLPIYIFQVDKWLPSNKESSNRAFYIFWPLHFLYLFSWQVVLYDEPTAGLDPIASTVVEDLIRSMHLKEDDAPGKITSYVVVTHQHSTIRRAVDRYMHSSKSSQNFLGFFFWLQADRYDK